MAAYSKPVRQFRSEALILQTGTKQPMETTYTPTAPQGYFYHTYLFEDWEVREKYPFWVLLVLANFIALIPLVAGILLLWFPYQYYLHIGAPFAQFSAFELSLTGKVVVGGLIIFGSMLLHEWLHGVALQFFRHRPHYAFNKFYLLATIEKGDYLTRQEYLWMTLTPLFLMTVGGGLLLLILPPVVGHLVLIALLLNTAASLGDLMVAIRVYRMPPQAVFTDDKGIQVFLPIHKKRAPSLNENAHTDKL